MWGDSWRVRGDIANRIACLGNCNRIILYQLRVLQPTSRERPVSQRHKETKGYGYLSPQSLLQYAFRGVGGEERAC